MSAPLLQVDGLSVAFGSKESPLRVVNNVHFSVNAGESVGIVGESGSGKSITALSILRLAPGQAQTSGRILFNGVDLLTLPDEHMPDIRGRDIGMVFQEPMSSLNPVMTIGAQVDEALLLHQKLTREERQLRVKELLALVGIPRPEERMGAFPHQFSGGMRQRVMIAMAVACSPRLIIADEPTTALDVTIQAQVLALLRDIRRRFNTALLLISHDLGVIAGNCERVAVMYAGCLVETGDVRSIYRQPAHPYTQALLTSIPRLDDDRKRLAQIGGTVPPPGPLRAGCAFHNRCPVRLDRCASQRPPSVALSPSHAAACWRLVPEAA